MKGCRTPTVAGCLPRTRSAGVGQASGEETAGGLGAAVRPVRSMGIWLRQGGGWAIRVPLDREDLAGRETVGVDLRRLGGGAGGSGWVNRGLGVGLSRAAPWPEAGMLRAFRRGDGHVLSALACGGARGACPGSKVSMTIMGPPQDGQG